MGAIDERLSQIEFAAISKVLSELPQDALDRLVRDPSLESPMTRLVRRIATRQVSPRSAGAKHPQHAIEDMTNLDVRAPALLGRAFQFLDGKAAAHGLPLLIADVHFRFRSEVRSAVDPILKNRFGTRT